MVIMGEQMENGDVFDRMRRPTMQQINYVKDLKVLEKKKRCGISACKEI